jgi:hypothetical protein
VIAVGQQVWWWNPPLGAWELFTITDSMPGSPLVEMRMPGRTQYARKDRIPSSTYEFATEEQFANAFVIHLVPRTHRQEVLGV